MTQPTLVFAFPTLASRARARASIARGRPPCQIGQKPERLGEPITDKKHHQRKILGGVRVFSAKDAEPSKRFLFYNRILSFSRFASCLHNCFHSKLGVEYLFAESYRFRSYLDKLVVRDKLNSFLK